MSVCVYVLHACAFIWSLSLRVRACWGCESDVETLCVVGDVSMCMRFLFFTFIRALVVSLLYFFVRKGGAE